ncbi:MAG TPA: hypothetical protein VME69_14540 [Methylocella sp.]|nr:hypothetical protein [Methylocella sp.]
MAEVEHLILEPLRHMRSQLDRIELSLEDVPVRLGHVELRLGHVERAAADHWVRLAEIDVKRDRLDAHVTRIERRLDLVES